MKRLSKTKTYAGILFSAVFFAALTSAQARTTYYIDPVEGNDASSGTSPTTAWKTLEKMNICFPSKSVTFVAGDSILLKAGTTFDRSQIWPAGNGTKANPIVIDKYGTGANPIINCHLGHDEPAGSTGQANGKDNGATIVFKPNSIGGWEVNNLELTNPNGMAAIKVATPSTATCQYFHFNNLKIHNIQGIPVPGEGSFMGGILFKMGSSLVDDILINSCEIYDVAWIGIQTGYWGGGDLPDPNNRITNLVIRNTKVHDCGQLGIILRSANKAVIDNCAIYRTGLARNAESFGIRLKHNNGSKIQFCEAYENFSIDNSGEGGQGFTFDGAAVACTLQYSYSHNNLGGFMSVISDPGEISSDNVIRYNISQNDSNQTFWFGVSGSSSNNTSIYNNTVYVAASVPLTKVVAYESGTNTVFRNNILCINRNATYDAGPSWDHNCFFGTNTNMPTDAGKITSDPLLNSPGNAGVGMASTAVYQLRTGSPCINAGIAIASNGGRDYWGTTVPTGASADIGACEGGDGTGSIRLMTPALRASAGNIAEIHSSANGTFTIKNLTQSRFSGALFNLNGSCIRRFSGEPGQTVALSIPRLSARCCIAQVQAGGRNAHLRVRI